jgi:hypothetical protein
VSYARDRVAVKEPGLGVIRFEVLGPVVFRVVADPTQAVPDTPVRVTFISPTPGVQITSCAAVFAKHAESPCTFSGNVWSALVKVPKDVPPGMILLRWGASANNTVGDRPAATSGTIDFRVLPPAPPTTARFTIVASPNPAAPDTRVSVSFSAAVADVEITDCLVAFVGGKDFLCERSGRGWSARLVVPRNTPAGTLPLRWGIASRRTADGTPGADNGILELGILPSREVPEPRFSVTAAPTTVSPEKAVTVSFSSPDNDVDITACSAGLGNDTQAGCQPSDQGWSVRLTVPRDAQRGLTEVQWRLSYLRKNGGRLGDRVGRLALAVLALQPQPAPSSTPARAEPSPRNFDIRQLLLRLGLIVALAAVGIGVHLVRRPRKGVPRPKPITGDAGEPPSPVPHVSVVSHPGRNPGIRTEESEQEPRHVRLAVHTPDYEIRTEELDG